MTVWEGKEKHDQQQISSIMEQIEAFGIKNDLHAKKDMSISELEFVKNEAVRLAGLCFNLDIKAHSPGRFCYTVPHNILQSRIYYFDNIVRLTKSLIHEKNNENLERKKELERQKRDQDELRQMMGELKGIIDE